MTQVPANDSPAAAAPRADAPRARALRAVDRLRDVIEQGAEDPKLLIELGTAILAAGAPPEAVDWMRAEAGRRGTDALAWFQLGRVVHGEEAVEAYGRAIALAPGSSSALINRGNLHAAAGRASEAIADYRRAHAVAPDLPAALFSLAVALRDNGFHDEALELFRKGGADVSASADMHSRYLFSLTRSGNASREAIFQAHLGFGARFCRGEGVRHANPATSDRRLRIGYVSGDLGSQTVSDFVEPMLAHHDPGAIDVHVYSTRVGDDMRVRRHVANWRDVAHLDDDRLAALVREDVIDILVDLSGHTGANRLTVFARKPAPVQVSFVGYPNTTGLTEIDYRLSDRFTAGDETQAFLCETLYRLPGAGTCYRPFAEIDVSPPPSLARGWITFGAPHTPSKLNDDLFDAWAAVLAGLPNSRLVLKYRGLDDPGVAGRISAAFASRGVAPERLTFEGPSLFKDYLRAYAGVDIVLDTFPCTGGTTTRNALWMGVPVISLRGPALYERISAGLLTAAGLEADCVADSQGAYVEKAIGLARDGARLATLRAGLRASLLRTGYFDPPRFTRELEAAYRDMWARWCAGRNGAGS